MTVIFGAGKKNDACCRDGCLHRSNEGSDIDIGFPLDDEHMRLLSYHEGHRFTGAGGFSYQPHLLLPDKRGLKADAYEVVGADNRHRHLGRAVV